MPPTAISSGSATAKPAMAQEMPPMELSREMVMGMSAPPTRMVKTMPNSVPVTNMRPRKNEGYQSGAMLYTTRASPMRPSSTLTIWLCRGSITGRCGNNWCSLPAATKEPAMVTMPEQRARQASTRWKAEGVPTTASMTIPTRAAEPPPKPCKKATSCGIWIILTLLDRKRPKTVPATMATQRKGDVREASLNMVRTMATAMAPALSAFPRTAVFTLLIRCSP